MVPLHPALAIQSLAEDKEKKEEITMLVLVVTAVLPQAQPQTAGAAPKHGALPPIRLPALRPAEGMVVMVALLLMPLVPRRLPAMAAEAVVRLTALTSAAAMELSAK